MLAEFALTSLVLIALPGPDQALIMRNALVGGRTAGVRTMLGGATGLTLHATAAALGVSALLATSAAPAPPPALRRSQPRRRSFPGLPRPQDPPPRPQAPRPRAADARRPSVPAGLR